MPENEERKLEAGALERQRCQLDRPETVTRSHPPMKMQRVSSIVCLVHLATSTDHSKQCFSDPCMNMGEVSHVLHLRVTDSSLLSQQHRIPNFRSNPFASPLYYSTLPIHNTIKHVLFNCCLKNIVD